ERDYGVVGQVLVRRFRTKLDLCACPNTGSDLRRSKLARYSCTISGALVPRSSERLRHSCATNDQSTFGRSSWAKIRPSWSFNSSDISTLLRASATLTTCST